MSYVGGVQGGVVERFLPGDVITCTVMTGQTIAGGDVVEYSGDRTVRPGQAGSFVVGGVALHNAAAGEQVSVAMVGVWPVTASGAIPAGSRVIAAAAGDVVVSGATPDARTVIGFAIEAAAGGIVPIKLTL